MLKIVVSSESWLRVLLRLPLSRSFVRGNITLLPTYEDRRVIDAVCSAIGLRNHTSKESVSGRFKDVDPIVVKLLRDRGRIRLHDIGVSSGITSLELFHALNASRVPVDFYISDKFAEYSVVRSPGITRIYDSNQELLCGYVLFVFADHQSSWLFFITKLLYHWIDGPPPATRQRETFLLYDRSVLQMLEAGRMHHIDYDVFVGKTGEQFNYVRCMNLLNRVYFSDEQIARALRNIRSSLTTGGILQVGRTLADGSNHVGFFENGPHGLRLIESLGDGTEIAELAESAA